MAGGKAFGFQLNDKLEKMRDLVWIIGFFVAFMPLYALGFMGMTRRLVSRSTRSSTPC
ncbi:hypothetical protein ACLB1M_06505 [Escherichia coli]